MLDSESIAFDCWKSRIEIQKVENLKNSLKQPVKYIRV